MPGKQGLLPGKHYAGYGGRMLSAMVFTCAATIFLCLPVAWDFYNIKNKEACEMLPFGGNNPAMNFEPFCL